MCFLKPAEGGIHSNALQAASAEGHLEIVQLLLDKTANVNARGIYGNALEAASAEFHLNIVKLLRRRGPEIPDPWTGSSDDRHSH